MKYKLKEIFDLQMGKTPARNNDKYWNTKDYKWISIADLTSTDKYINNTKEYISRSAVKESGIKIIPANTVVMSFKLSIGKTAILSEDMYSNEAIMAFHDKHVVELLPEYTYYLIKAKNWNGGSNRAVMGQTLNKATLSEIEVDVHTIDEQRKIVELLNLLGKIIYKRNTQLSKLEDILSARFVELFGDPLNNTKGWGEQRLGECCVINPKKNIDSRLEEDLVISFIPMASVSENGEILKLEDRFYRDVKNGFTYFCEGDVLFAKITPCMENGKGAVAVGLKNSIGFGSTEFHVLRPIKEKSNSYWLYVLTSFDFFRKKAEENMTGSAGQKRVQASFLENIKISVPPITLQIEFEQFVHQVNKSKLLAASQPQIHIYKTLTLL